MGVGEGRNKEQVAVCGSARLPLMRFEPRDSIFLQLFVWRRAVKATHQHHKRGRSISHSHCILCRYSRLYVYMYDLPAPKNQQKNPPKQPTGVALETRSCAALAALTAPRCDAEETVVRAMRKSKIALNFALGLSMQVKRCDSNTQPTSGSLQMPNL